MWPRVAAAKSSRGRGLRRHFDGCAGARRSPLLARHGRARLPQDARTGQRLRRPRSAQRQAVALAAQIRRSPTGATASAAISCSASSPRSAPTCSCGSTMPTAPRPAPAATAPARRAADDGGARRQPGAIETAAGVLPVTAGVQGYTVDMGRPRFGWDEIPLARPMDTLALDLALGPLAQPVGSTLAIRTRSSSSPTPRPCRSPSSARARARSAVPRARQYRRRRGARSAHDPAAGLGARRRPDPGLRQRRLRRAGGGGAPRPDRARGRGPARRRRAEDRLERGRSGPDDRPGQPQLQGPPRPGAAGGHAA